jgi:hypothetical protein
VRPADHASSTSPLTAPTRVAPTRTSLRPVRRARAVAALLVLLAGVVVTDPSGAAIAATSIQFVLSPPDVVTSALQGQDGVRVETFEGFDTALGPVALGASGTLAVGTFTSSGTVRVFADDVWGGSGSRYLAVNTGASLDVTLTDPSRYLGFWWAAGNAGDLVTLFGSDGGIGPETQLGVFDSDTLVTLLAGATVTAIDTNAYATSLYKRLNAAGQPFAYVNLQMDDASLYFTRVVFSKTGTGGLELDNLTTSAAWGQAVPGASGSVDDPEGDDSEGGLDEEGDDPEGELDEEPQPRAGDGGEATPPTGEAIATATAASTLRPTQVSAGAGPMRTSDPIRSHLPLLVLALGAAGLLGVSLTRRSAPATT